jgi:hypothetical protein
MKLTYAEHIDPLLDNDRQSPVIEQNTGVILFIFFTKKEDVPENFLGLKNLNI